MKLTTQQTNLFEWVKQQHGSQVRKYTGEPYCNHLERVATLLYAMGHENLIEIALCHDLLEDTETTEDTLVNTLLLLSYDLKQIGFIRRGVVALTDQFTMEAYPDTNRKSRKMWETMRLKTILPEYQTVKYADLIDNTSSIVQYDKNFAKIYLEEKRVLLEGMKAGCKELYELAKNNLPV